MSVNKESIRKMLEEYPQQKEITKLDELALQRVLHSLEKDIPIKLPVNFADRLVEKIAQKQTQNNRFGWLGLVFGIVGLVIALVVSLALVNFQLDLGFLTKISNYYGLFLFGAGFIFLLNLIDKKFLNPA